MKLKSLFFLGILFTSSAVYAVDPWDVTTPLGSEAKSLGDDRIREMKRALTDALEHQGSFPGPDTASPRYINTVATGTTGLRPTGSTNTAAGMFFVNISSGCIEQYDGANWNCLEVVGSSAIVSGDLAVSVAGDGLAGGGGEPLRVNVDSNTFTITNDTITIIANSIGSTQLADAVSFTSVNASTYTRSLFGILPILQIQTYTLNTSSDITTTAFSRTLAGSITPKLSTSKIMVIGAGNLGCSGAGVCYGTLYRDTTHLASSDGGFATNTAASNLHVTMLSYDSPATTSSTEYSIRTRVNGGGVTASLPGTDGGAYTTTASLILVEIAQ